MLQVRTITIFKKLLLKITNEFRFYIIQNRFIFYVGDVAYFLSFADDLVDNMTLSKIIQCLTPILINPNILKITNNVKEHIKLLGRIENFEDVEILNYVAGTTDKKYEELITYTNNDIYKMEKALISILIGIEQNGIKICVPVLKMLSKEFGEKIKKLERKYIQLQELNSILARHSKSVIYLA